MTEIDKKFFCSICGLEFSGFGNNAAPINDGRCCDLCNDEIVIPRRLIDIMRKTAEKEKELIDLNNTKQTMTDIKQK